MVHLESPTSLLRTSSKWFIEIGNKSARADGMGGWERWSKVLGPGGQERGQGLTMLKIDVKPPMRRQDRGDGKGAGLKWCQEQQQDDQTPMHKVNIFASHPRKERGDSPASRLPNEVWMDKYLPLAIANVPHLLSKATHSFLLSQSRPSSTG